MASRFEPTSGQWLQNIEPATGSEYGRIADSGEEDVNLAVEAAEGAFSTWSSMGSVDRADCMQRLADAVEANLEDLARLETIDNGKPISLARSLDIPRAVSNLRFFAETALADRTEEYETGDAALNTVLRQPVGVVGLISPWNLPLYLLTWKIAPALAAGNTVVAKPSELTPVTAARLGELSVEAGFPAGVLNIIHGTGPSAGEAIVSHPRIRAVSFTGGTSTGARIAEDCSSAFQETLVGTRRQESEHSLRGCRS